MHDDVGSAGREIAHYRLIEKIGEGGMGVVYKAWDSRLERLVALKLLRREVLNHGQARARLLREARLASALNHPYIATIYELQQVDDQDVIAMEFVQGQTLGRRLAEGPIEVRSVIDIALAVADALGEAHAAGIVHRDIKPDNIILTPRGYPKITDFGLAKVVDVEDASASSEAATKLTREGAVMGTVAYMSPEQAAGRPTGAPADIFSLGVVLYEMLTRRPAFAGDSDVDVLYDILHRDPPPVGDLNPEAPAELQAIVRRCTEKDPKARYPDARALHADLKLARVNLDVQRARTLDTLLHVSREMTSILDLGQLLERIATLVRGLIDYDVLGIFRLDEAGGRFVWLGGAGYVAERAKEAVYPADRGLCGAAIRAGKAICVGDVTGHPDYYPPNGEVFRANLAVPLFHQDKIIGVLNMESRTPHFFTSEHVTIMATLGGPIAVAISNVEMFEDRRRHVLAMETLHEIGREISSILDQDLLLERVAALTRRVIDHDFFAIFLLDSTRGEFAWRVAAGYDDAIVKERVLRLGEGVISRAVSTRAAVIVDDVATDPDYVPARTADGRQSRSELTVPMIAQERVLGVVVLESVEPNAYSPEHAAWLTVLASQVAGALENARLYRELHDHARSREEEAERVRRRFESYVTPHIAEQLFRDPSSKTLVGERRNVTVLVADIRGFTELAETVPGEEVVGFLREFFSLGSHVVFKYEGTVDKFLGDALMAIYGAPVAHDPRYGPSDPQRAVFAALDLRDAFPRLREKWWNKNDAFGKLELVVGINGGDCLLGNMGTDRRVEYTAIGHVVNQAFRYCREAVAGEIRIGGATYDNIQDDVRVEPLAEGTASSGPAAHRVLGLKYF